MTIIRDAAGRYFASFVVETTSDDPLPPVGAEVGIDLGLTHFAVLSNGTKVPAPKFLRRAARKLRRLQQDVSRKQRGSSKRKKAVVKVARAHARVADTRRDWQHKLSTRIIRDSQAVYVEDLCVTGLARTRLAKSVHDAGWSQLRRACWNTRPSDTGGPSPASAGSRPRLRRARCAAVSTDPSR